MDTACTQPGRVALWMAGLLIFSGWAPPPAHADRLSYVHTVRPGETLASIARQYYGDAQRENVLVAENGLATQGGAPIVVGLRLVVPRVTYHRVQAGETWSELALRYYGHPRRAFMLIEANRGTPGKHPDEGAELIVPYPLRHLSVQGDTATRLAQMYYGNPKHTRRIRRFNLLRTNRIGRGRIVLIPLADLKLSEEGRKLIEKQTGVAPAQGEVRDLQARIDEQLPALREQVRTGGYAEAVALANRLLGQGELTGNQIVTVQRELGTAYVALDRLELAEQAFQRALERQPDLELDALRTSPIVLEVLERARTNVKQGDAP